MQDDFENPARQYRGFRPRQAATSGYSPAAPTTNANHGLYNNSTIKYLVVRRVVCVCASAPVAIFQKGFFGSALGTVSPIMPGEALIEGQHTYADNPPSGQGIYLFTVPTSTGPAWQQDYPMCVLAPGWSLRITDPTAAEQMSVSFFWEAIFPRELDFDW